MTPVNGVHYKFRGFRWYHSQSSISTSGWTGHSGVMFQGDARYAAFGRKNGAWRWLGTCSMNNTSVNTSNTTDPLTATYTMANDNFTPNPSNLVSGSYYGYKWEFSQNVDFYESYMIKHVRLGAGATGGTGPNLYQKSDNFQEFEWI